MQQEEVVTRSGKLPLDTMVVEEWLHANHKRLVKIRFGPDVAINIIGRKGEKLRTADFKSVDSVHVEESAGSSSKRKPVILIKVPRDHDMVLELDSIGSRKKFMNKLEMFLSSNKKNLICSQVCEYSSYCL